MIRSILCLIAVVAILAAPPPNVQADLVVFDSWSSTNPGSDYVIEIEWLDVDDSHLSIRNMSGPNILSMTIGSSSTGDWSFDQFAYEVGEDATVNNPDAINGGLRGNAEIDWDFGGLAQFTNTIFAFDVDFDDGTNQANQSRDIGIDFQDVFISVQYANGDTGTFMSSGAGPFSNNIAYLGGSAAVPEPSSGFLLVAFGLLIYFRRTRRRHMLQHLAGGCAS